MSAMENGWEQPVTPVLVKTSKDLRWPEDEPIFYILGRNGLYLCRNHEFFRSCVPARQGPSMLEEQTVLLIPHFPMIPRELFEQAVGFFEQVADLHCAEAAILLVWDRTARCVRLVVPEQTVTVHRGYNDYRYPIGVHYVPPTNLPPGWVSFGDIHSHVNFSAFASHTDVADEKHAAGLHVVVGRIQEEPPQIHVEAVVDGTRFKLEASHVIEDYCGRSTDVPPQWFEQLKVEEVTSYYWSGRAS